MTHRLFALAAVAAGALAMAGCGERQQQSPGQTEPVAAVQDTVGAGVGAISAATLGRTTDGYVTNAMMSDMYEVEAGRIAAERGQSPQVRQFGQRMVQDHTAMVEQFRQALQASGAQVTPPTALDERRQGMIDNLRGVEASEFDGRYLQQQEAAHDEALTLHRTYAEHGDNERLRQVAAQAAPKVEQHLQNVRQIRGGQQQGQQR